MCQKRHVFFMAKEEIFRNRLSSWFFGKQLGAFPVKRGAGDTAALDTARAIVGDGRLLGIFPEGTRSRDGQLGRAKSGAALIAAQTGASILPAAIITKNQKEMCIRDRHITGQLPGFSKGQKRIAQYILCLLYTSEIYDYLRLLYARIGIPHCPICGREIKQQTVDQIVDRVMALEEGTRIQVLAPVVRGRKGEHSKEFEAARKSGYVPVSYTHLDVFKRQHVRRVERPAP